MMKFRPSRAMPPHRSRCFQWDFRIAAIAAQSLGIFHHVAAKSIATLGVCYGGSSYRVRLVASSCGNLPKREVKSVFTSDTAETPESTDQNDKPSRPQNLKAVSKKCAGCKNTANPAQYCPIWRPTELVAGGSHHLASYRIKKKNNDQQLVDLGTARRKIWQETC